MKKEEDVRKKEEDDVKKEDGLGPVEDGSEPVEKEEGGPSNLFPKHGPCNLEWRDRDPAFWKSRRRPSRDVLNKSDSEKRFEIVRSVSRQNKIKAFNDRRVDVESS